MLAKKLAKMAERLGYLVLHEPIIPTVLGPRKPDLVFWKEGSRAWVVDVTVAWEGYDSLDEPHFDKCVKYDRPEVRDFCREKCGVNPAFTTLTVTWRGCMSAASAADLRLLELQTKDLALLSQVCVEQTAWLHRVYQKNAFRRGLSPSYSGR